jgi:hypothetical protein
MMPSYFADRTPTVQCAGSAYSESMRNVSASLAYALTSYAVRRRLSDGAYYRQ